MEMTDILTIILGSAGLFTFLQFLITFVDGKINTKKNDTEKDLKRIELLLMISDYPDMTEEIMEVAEYYFKHLKGNWFAHKVFKEWLDKKGLDKPNWFD